MGGGGWVVKTKNTVWLRSISELFDLDLTWTWARQQLFTAYSLMAMKWRGREMQRVRFAPQFWTSIKKVIIHHQTKSSLDSPVQLLIQAVNRVAPGTFRNILEHSACILEHSGTFWMHSGHGACGGCVLNLACRKGSVNGKSSYSHIGRHTKKI